LRFGFFVKSVRPRNQDTLGGWFACKDALSIRRVRTDGHIADRELVLFQSLDHFFKPIASGL
jgi:hypothetical protein